jgi:hypothetical protein
MVVSSCHREYLEMFRNHRLFCEDLYVVSELEKAKGAKLCTNIVLDILHCARHTLNKPQTADNVQHNTVLILDGQKQNI